MAKAVVIDKSAGPGIIVLDGATVSDVISYVLQETSEGKTLTLKIAVTGTVSVQR